MPDAVIPNEPAPAVRLRHVATAELQPTEAEAVRSLLWSAFGTGEDAFTEADWDHALGGVHVLADAAGRIVGHASVVTRALEAGAVPLRTGYVEAVAVAPDRQGRGVGRVIMESVNRLVRAGFELGALGTGSQSFYERLGWRVWPGPSGVRLGDGSVEPTPDEDGYILVLETPTTPVLDWSARLTCEWRPGDVW
jgi:aminoglycoside 2'-N-acetyltransferase I